MNGPVWYEGDVGEMRWYVQEERRDDYDGGVEEERRWGGPQTHPKAANPHQK